MCLVVVDGTDNFATRYLVNDACASLQKPNVFASIFQFEGQCSIFASQDGPCYRCLYPSPPPAKLMPNCAEGGVFGVLPGIMGCIQAAEVIKSILGLGDSLKGRLLSFNALTMQFSEFKLRKDPNCEICSKEIPFDKLKRPSFACGQIDDNDIEHISVQELKQCRDDNADIQIIDVRNPYEYDICHINGKLIPLSELESRINEIDPTKMTILQCKSGGRSLKAAKLLKQHGFTKIKNLSGGILAWAREIDQSMSEY